MKKGRFKSKDDSVYNPHNNSEDEDGQVYNEIISMISQSRNCSQMTLSNNGFVNFESNTANEPPIAPLPKKTRAKRKPKLKAVQEEQTT